MKFKDIKTLNHFLKEYGMTAGAPSYGSNAKKSMPSVAEPQQSKSIAKPKGSNSPTVNGKKPDEQEQVLKFAHKLKKDEKVMTKQGELTVVSPVGMNSTAIANDRDDVIVAVDDQGSPFVFDRNDQLEIKQQLNAGKLSDLAKKGSTNLHLDQKSSKKFKRLVRKNKLREQGDELIFEINFNRKSIAQEALDLPIKCGFEAESVWYNHYSIGNGEDDEDWLYEYNWYDIEDMVRDQEGSRSAQNIEQAYEDWCSEKAMDREADFVVEIRNERVEDEYYINEYIENQVSESDIEDYKERRLDDLPEEDQEEYEDWDFMNWGREYVEEELMDDFMEYLEEEIRDSGEAMDRAYDDVKDDYDIDRWADYEYGSWQSCLYEFDIYLSNPDGGNGSIEDVANDLMRWVEDNSFQSDVDYSSEYHGTVGSNSQWRVEPDSSIDDGGNAGAEIISPVYSTPRKMLSELKKLMNWWDDSGDVGTNSSTGLHVTMSYTMKQDAKVNPVKLAVLLGDKYLLQTFGREKNSYTKSQMARLEKHADVIKRDPNNVRSLSAIEQVLMDAISYDKFSSINFKSEKDKSTGNKLVEFRIGGGSDYHKDFNKVAKAVIRYATTLDAAYNPEKFNKDYASALFRLVAQAGQISKDTDDYVKSRYDVEHPAIDVLKDFFGKENYIDSMSTLSSAFNDLAEYKKLSDPNADKKWKQEVADYEKATGRKVGENINEVEEGEPIRGYIEPNATPPSQRAPAELKLAQKKFARAIGQAGYDFNQNLNRAPAKAKSIGILRKTLPEFEMDYEDLSTLVQREADHVSTNENEQRIKLSRIKNGVDRLFKKDVLKLPEFVTRPQLEKLITGMWNAFNSGEIQDSAESKKLIKLLAKAVAPNEDEEQAQDRIAYWIDEVNSAPKNSDGQKRREFNTFQRNLIAGVGYRSQALLEPGNPINKEAMDKLLTYLEKYPEWNHPVAKGHNPAITGDDSYQENFVAKMMVKMRLRWEHLEDIRQENPGVYIDSIRKIAELVENLVDMNEEQPGNLQDWLDGIEGTDHENLSDGPMYFGMSPRYVELLKNSIRDIDNATPFNDPVAFQLRDRLQNYLGDAFNQYYSAKSRRGSGFYKIGEIPDLIRDRVGAIEDFLKGFNEVFKKLGFEDQQASINSKMKLDKKQDEFDKKFGPEYIAKIDGFEYGGDIFVTKEFHDNLGDMTDRALAQELEFSNNIHRSDRGAMLVIPSAHYFTALDAKEVLEKDRYKNTWRETLANQILNKFYNIYGITFTWLEEQYVNINDYVLGGDIKSQLKDRDVMFTDKLGDGRIGMGQFAPLLPQEELKGPHGEPFSPSSATSWKLNNPELAKKVNADEKKRKKETQNFKELLKAAGVEDYESYSSSSIADSTSWGDLADHLKIPRGVGDQGVNLLKRIYDKYDNDHNWRPESDPDACCAPRWAAAVRAAKEYIEKYYIESGGNYFRKNADGSIGDDVSGVYRSDYRGDTDGSNTPRVDFSLGELDSVELTDTSYAEARGNYELFDGMMQNGVGYYIKQVDANRLVKFLVGPFSESYKRAVLKALAYNQENGGEPADIQQALALGRQQMESIFDKFDKLPLAEQLRIIAQVDKNKIDEAWSKKYKDSINCSNPKGFSQKAHCAGKKKKTNEISDFKKRELEYELRHEKNNYAVKINGKVWKVVSSRSQAQKMVRTLLNRGKDASFVETGLPLSEGKAYVLDIDGEGKFYFKTEQEAKKWIKFLKSKGHQGKITIKSTQIPGKFDEGSVKNWAMNKYGDDFMDKPLRPTIQYRPADVNRSLRYNPDQHKEAVIKSKMRKQNISRQQAEKQVAMLLRKDPDYFTAKRQMSESVPDNSTMTKIVKLMKSPILANDLKAQMEAYFAVPDPQMIRAFRDARSQGGDKVDLRGIFKSYLRKLHSSQKKKLNISESRGVTARAQGEEYVSKEDPEDILTVQEIFVTPEDSSNYETYQDLENALDQIIPQDSVRINDNNPNSGTKAALIAHVTDKNGTPQFWVRFIRAIPPGGVTGLWKTLNGYQFRKGAEQESIPIKPSDLIKDENFKSTSEIEREVMQNLYNQVKETEHEPLYDIMQKAIDLAKENSQEPIPEADKYFNVLQKYSGEYLGPIALIDGNSKEGDTQAMLDAYGLETLSGSTVMFPQDTAYALIDSLMKTPDGKEIGISSKIHTSGGAASSIGGVYKQLTDEIKSRHPKGSKIMEVLATESAINGPIKVAVMLNILSPSDAKELVEFDRSSQNVDDIQSPKLKQLTLNQGVAQGTLDRPDYRVFFHALTAVAVKMIEAVNEIQDFKDAILESLNNNNYIQILTKGKKMGDGVSLSYYTKFPATYQGEPKLENKNYFATGQKGRIGFKLKK